MAVERDASLPGAVRIGSRPRPCAFALAALGYDAAALLFDAMTRARSLGGDDLRDALQATKDLEGVTGTLSIDDARNARKSAVVIGFDHEVASVVARIEPPR